MTTQVDHDRATSNAVSNPTAVGVGHCVYLLAWHKAGSQWLRDLLTHRLAIRRHKLAISGLTFPVIDGDGVLMSNWPTPPSRSFVGPVYVASPDDWRQQRKPGDRAVVLLRDPRDISVSLVHSLTLSHQRSEAIDPLRAGLLALPDFHRFVVSMRSFFRPKALADWGQLGRGICEDVYITTYESLNQDAPAELQRIFDFLNWNIPPADIQHICEERSFERRSGRSKGQEDRLSHYRKGVVGDWRSHFDQLTGLTLQLLIGDCLLRSGMKVILNGFYRCPSTPAMPCDSTMRPTSRRWLSCRRKMFGSRSRTNGCEVTSSVCVGLPSSRPKRRNTVLSTGRNQRRATSGLNGIVFPDDPFGTDRNCTKSTSSALALKKWKRANQSGVDSALRWSKNRGLAHHPLFVNGFLSHVQTVP
ncbi:MAG: sulfotransferase domain-containing protein [Planctomycetaceae bacterium]